MKVCVIGPGAIGGLLAEAFARAGDEVCLIARGEHLGALQAGGLRVRGVEGERRYALAASHDPADFPHQDVVVIAVKTYSIGAILPTLAPLLGADTAVVPAINGLPWWYFARHPVYRDGAQARIACLDPDGALERALDARHIAGCVVHAAGEVVAPGVIEQTSPQRYVVGEPDGVESARVRRIVASLGRGGVEAEATASIRNAIWMKLIGNLSYNPVAALTLSRMNEMNGSEALLDIARTLMRETMAVAEHYGERVTMTIEERIAIARRIGSGKISMHQDLERGRPLEIDAIVTSVLELAARAGIATPTIRLVHTLISERAKHL